MSNFIQAGESTVRLTKVKPMQLAEIRSQLQKRPQRKFSLDLSPEAQAALQETMQERQAQDAAVKKGKRGSKGTVLFNEKVDIKQDEEASTTAAAVEMNTGRRASYSDIFEIQPLDRIYTSHIGDLLDNRDSEASGMASPRRFNGRRRNSTPWIPIRRGSLNTGATSVDEVDEVGTANTLTVPSSPHL